MSLVFKKGANLERGPVAYEFCFNLKSNTSFHKKNKFTGSKVKEKTGCKNNRLG